MCTLFNSCSNADVDVTVLRLSSRHNNHLAVKMMTFLLLLRFFKEVIVGRRLWMVVSTVRYSTHLLLTRKISSCHVTLHWRHLTCVTSVIIAMSARWRKPNRRLFLPAWILVIYCYSCRMEKLHCEILWHKQKGETSGIQMSLNVNTA